MHDLVTALRQQALALRAPDGTPLRVDLRADRLQALPAAVEVAVYRIVVEALTNVARHSTSTNATVSLTLREEALEIEITDDGSARTPWQAGVGIASMGERAAELGGTLSAEGTPGAAECMQCCQSRRDMRRQIGRCRRRHRHGLGPLCGMRARDTMLAGRGPGLA